MVGVRRLSVLLLMASCGLTPGCGDQLSVRADAQPVATIDGSSPDASSSDAAPTADATALSGCHRSRNPTGEFAVTSIRAMTASQPGNTWEAIGAAYRAGYRYIEIDLRLSRDGRLIPGRVDDLSDFTDCIGSVRVSAAADLAACHYRKAPSVVVRPLEDGFAGVDFDGVYLDLKFTADDRPEEIESALAAVASFRAAVSRPDSVVAMAYAPAFAAALAGAGERTGWKGYPDPDAAPAFVEAGAQMGVEMICVEARSLDADLLDRSTELGVWHLPWEYVSQTDRALLDLLFDHGAGGLITEAVDDVAALVPPACAAEL
jgi:glycerophosphoryl diester phosphodiesterase